MASGCCSGLAGDKYPQESHQSSRNGFRVRAADVIEAGVILVAIVFVEIVNVAVSIASSDAESVGCISAAKC